MLTCLTSQVTILNVHDGDANTERIGDYRFPRGTCDVGGCTRGISPDAAVVVQQKWRLVMKTRRMIGTLSAVVGIAAGLVAIYEFLQSSRSVSPPVPPPNPTSAPGPTRSFLQRVSGTYSLASWVPAQRPVELGFRVAEGSLTVHEDGTMDWSVLLVQTYSSNPGRVRMTARGKIQVSAQRVMGVSGGQYNNTQYLDNRGSQVGSDVELAIRGWYPGQPDDTFRLALDEGVGRSPLEMSNSRGVFAWAKK